MVLEINTVSNYRGRLVLAKNSEGNLGAIGLPRRQLGSGDDNKGI